MFYDWLFWRKEQMNTYEFQHIIMKQKSQYKFVLYYQISHRTLIHIVSTGSIYKTTGDKKPNNIFDLLFIYLIDFYSSIP